MLNGQVNIAFSSEFVVAEEGLANDSFYTIGTSPNTTSIM